MTGGEIFVECLKAQGVKTIFGMPGGHLNPVYESLYESREQISHYVVRHEGGAAFMADGYARSTGDIGVCLTIPGPGSTNASTGLGEAYTANSPVLLVTGQNSSHLDQKDPSKSFHGLDQKTFLSPITKHIEIVKTVDQIPGAVNRTFGAMRSGRPKPALIELATDALTAEADLAIPIRNDGLQPVADAGSLEKALDLIQQSKRPFILAGSGVNHSRASTELEQLAKLLNAPVATTAMGKGCISEDSPFALGVFRSAVTRKAIEHSDLIIALGTRFVYRETGNWTMKIKQPLLQVDADPTEISKEYTAQVGICADVQICLKQLNQGLQDQPRQDGWGKRTNQLRQQFESNGRPQLIEDLRETMPRDAILAVDVHVDGYSALPHFWVYHPGTFIYSPISVSMGLALPSAIGAQIAYPDRKVVAIAGDGGFLMTSPDLATAVKYNLPIVIIVVNDNKLTSIEGGQLKQFGATLGINLLNPDFVKFAESFGAIGFRVEGLSNFQSTLEKALNMKKTSLIEVVKQ